MGFRTGVVHDDKWKTELLGHVAGYAIGGVVMMAALYIAALYLLAG